MLARRSALFTDVEDLADLGEFESGGLRGADEGDPRDGVVEVVAGNDRDAFLGPYRTRTLSRNFHRAMRSARRSTGVFKDAEAALRSELAHLPVFTVFGENNDPFGFADRWQNLFPDASSWIVPGGNHFPMCDDPIGYAERLRAWHSGHR